MSIAPIRSFAIIVCAILTMGLAPANISPLLLEWLKAHPTSPSQSKSDNDGKVALLTKNISEGDKLLSNKDLPIGPRLSPPSSETRTPTDLPEKKTSPNNHFRQNMPSENKNKFSQDTSYQTNAKADLAVRKVTDQWSKRLQSMWPDQKDMWGMHHLTTKKDLVRIKSSGGISVPRQKGEISRTTPSSLIERQEILGPTPEIHTPLTNDCASSKDLSILLSSVCVREMEAIHLKGPQFYSAENLPAKTIPEDYIASNRPEDRRPNPYPVLCHISFFPTSGESVIHDVRISSTKDCMSEADIISRGRTGHEAVTIDDEITKAHFDVTCTRSSPFTIACRAR